MILAERDYASVVDDAVAIVSAGYDALADRFLDWAGRVEGDPRERFCAALAARLPPSARVLDLGCGAGLPSTRALAERYDVVGVDVSPEQVARARANVPAATVVCADLAAVSFPDASFDAVSAFYSISHVPRALHAALFGRIARWLAPGGWLLASLGAGDGPDWRGDWLGVPMFFSAFDADTNRRLLRDAGFRLELDEVVTMREPEGEVAFLWVLARTPER